MEHSSLNTLKHILIRFISNNYYIKFFSPFSLINFLILYKFPIFQYYLLVYRRETLSETLRNLSKDFLFYK